MYTARGTLEPDGVISSLRPAVRRAASQLMARLPPSVDVNDLVQAGMIALFDAMGRFDPATDVQFETFAMQRVRGAMLDELRSYDWMPRSVRKSQRTIDQAIRTVEQREQRSATEREVADVLGVSLDEYQRMLGEARGTQLVYMDDVGDDDGEEGFVERNLAADRPTPLDRLQDSRFRSALVASIKELPEREGLVMSLYYEQDLNLKEIGAVLGVTESRVSQIHSQAVARIRSHLTDWL